MNEEQGPRYQINQEQLEKVIAPYFQQNLSNADLNKIFQDAEILANYSPIQDLIKKAYSDGIKAGSMKEASMLASLMLKATSEFSVVDGEVIALIDESPMRQLPRLVALHAINKQILKERQTAKV